MIAKYRAVSTVFILLISFSGFKATGQPTLPDIAGSADKGIVVLSWNCQYSGIKSIAVLRSSDSVNNYLAIGAVKQLEKGLQAFVDGHPNPGKNYYKLLIAFRSGLKWSSNHCSVYIEQLPVSSTLKLPSNDSLQHFTVTEEKTLPGAGNGKAHPDSNIANAVKTQPKRKVSISFDQDISQPDIKTNTRDSSQPMQARHKIIISFDDPEINPTVFIKSRFINADPLTGHVFMNLPDDVNQHHYSVKFYDQKNHLVFEVPKLKAPKIIFDKRDFQHKGVYKFILRKDAAELETGYVNL